MFNLADALRIKNFIQNATTEHDLDIKQGLIYEQNDIWWWIDAIIKAMIVMQSMVQSE